MTAFLCLGDDPNRCNATGYSPMMVCASGSDKENIMQLLHAHGATPDMRHPTLGVTALHLALSYSKFAAAEVLLDAGADPSLRDVKGLCCA